MKLKVEEFVEGHGKVVSWPVFTIHSYEEDNLLGWTYQLFDAATRQLYKDGDSFEETKLRKERRAR